MPRCFVNMPTSWWRSVMNYTWGHVLCISLLFTILEIMHHYVCSLGVVKDFNQFNITRVDDVILSMGRAFRMM